MRNIEYFSFSEKMKKDGISVSIPRKNITKLDIFKTNLKNGYFTPPHKHEKRDEYFCIINDGNVMMFLDNEIKICDKNDVIYVGPNIWHSIFSISSQTTTLNISLPFSDEETDQSEEYTVVNKLAELMSYLNDNNLDELYNVYIKCIMHPILQVRWDAYDVVYNYLSSEGSVLLRETIGKFIIKMLNSTDELEVCAGICQLNDLIMKNGFIIIENKLGSSLLKKISDLVFAHFINSSNSIIVKMAYNFLANGIIYVSNTTLERTFIYHTFEKKLLLSLLFLRSRFKLFAQLKSQVDLDLSSRRVKSIDYQNLMIFSCVINLVQKGKEKELNDIFVDSCSNEEIKKKFSEIICCNFQNELSWQEIFEKILQLA